MGDPLSLIFEILDPDSPYEIFVRDLIALDGATDAELTLIDERGCPADPTIMSELKKSLSSDKILVSRFDAFRFPRWLLNLHIYKKYLVHGIQQPIPKLRILNLLHLCCKMALTRSKWTTHFEKLWRLKIHSFGIDCWISWTSHLEQANDYLGLYLVMFLLGCCLLLKVKMSFI